MSHSDDDWDEVVVFVLLGEGRSWPVLFVTTTICILLLVYHYWF